MHDFLLAKQIVDELKIIIKEKKIEKAKSVTIEIGSVALAHDDLPEHTDDISIENLEFALANISKGTTVEGVKFNIKKVKGQSYNIKNIEI